MNKTLLLASLAFAATCATILLLRPFAERLRLLDAPGGRKAHQAATPMIGGIGIFTGLLIGSSGVPHWLQNAAPFLSAGSILVAIGFLDDRNDIRKRVRLAAQLLTALIMIYWAGIRIDSLGNLFDTGVLDLGLLAVPVTIIATMGVINAINMMDGADGLAGGLSLTALLFLGGFAWFGGRLADAQILFLLMGGVAAFMLFNYRLPGRGRARVFMGDAGSTFLGFAICWFAISLSQGPQPAMQPIMAVWLIAIPLLDMLAVMIRRALNGRSPMLPDREHVHHLLQRHGFTTGTTVNWIIGTSVVVAAAATAASVLGVSEALLFAVFWAWVAIHIAIAQGRATALQAHEAVATAAKPAHFPEQPAANTPAPYAAPVATWQSGDRRKSEGASAP